jgi:ParB/RepB/Spo0J family partition protein
MSATVTKITPPPPTVLPDVQLVAIEQLYASKDNPRSDLGDLEELTASIKQIGILQPIRVVTNTEGAGYIIVSGHRRHAAAIAAGAVEVPVLIEALEEEDRITVQLVENLHREDLSPLDKAAGFQQLIDLGNSQGTVAKMVGVSQGTVSKHLALLKLPEKGRELVESGAITQEEGITLAGLPTEIQESTLQDITEETADGDATQVARIASWMIQDAKSEQDDRAEVANEIATLKAAGVPIVEFNDIKPTGKLTAGPVYLHQIYWVKAAKHKTAECRAIGIREDGLGIIDLCMTPKNHPQPKTAAQKMGREVKTNPDEEAKKAEYERLSALLSEANERRREWLIGLDAPLAKILDALIGFLLLDRDYDDGPDIEGVMSWLDLDDVEDAEVRRAAKVETLVQHPTSDKERIRMLLLLAASGLEEREFHPGYASAFRAFEGDQDLVQGYLEQLVNLGYELSWIEQKWAGLPFEEPLERIEEVEPPDDEDPVIDVLPEIYVSLKGKRWTRRCSICGVLPGFNTTEEQAIERGQIHLSEDHDVDVAS